MITHALLLTALIAASDPASRPVEPLEIGAIHLFDAKTNKLQPLEYRRGYPHVHTYVNIRKS